MATRTRTRRPDAGLAAQETTMTDAVATAPVADAPVTDAAAPAEAQDAQAEQNDGAEATDGKSKKNTAPIQLTVPLDLKAIIKQRAEAAGKTSARWVLENVASDLEYTLPVETRMASERGGVKMTDVFAKNLSPAAKKERLAAAKTLLDALAAGKIDLEAIKAQLGV